MGRSFETSVDESPESALKRFFQRHGYVRVADLGIREELGRKYKKGYEVRLVAVSRREVAWLRRLLKQVGFKPGKPFQKHSRIVQPIYGRVAVEWFLSSKPGGRRVK